MAQRDLRVCFVGDSYVAGTGDSSGLGWVGRVTAAAFARGLPLTTYNLGVRGDTSVLVSERLAREVRPRLREAGDPRVIVSFGVNDTVVEANGPRATTAETLAAFARICRDAGAALMLVGPPAVDDDHHNERIELLDRALAEAAASAEVPFVEAFTATSVDEMWRQQVRDGDRFHPDTDGYRRLADVVTDPVLHWLG